MAWLLANSVPAHQSRSLTVAAYPPGLQLLPPEQTGVRFTNQLPLGRHLTNQIYLNGSGVAAGDIDGDGLPDLFFCGLESSSRLYRNHGGWTFQDVTDSAGLSRSVPDATGAAFADLDGDGDLDLVVSTVGFGTRLFWNEGSGRFRADRLNDLNPGMGGTSLALADLNGDGTLDLYLANYRTVTLRDQPNTRFGVTMVNGQPQITSVNERSIQEPDLRRRFEFAFKSVGGRQSLQTEENGEPDAIYLNNGRGRFTALSFTNGAFLDESGRPLTEPPYDWGLSVMIRDLNGDGLPDIYVCNDFKSPDRLWLGQGRGQFRAAPPEVFRQMPFSSMGLDVADLNRDGHFDLFQLDMLSRDHARRMTQRIDTFVDYGDPTGRLPRQQVPRNTLLVARGDGTFAEAAQFAGLAAAEWAWTPVFLDVDLDGFEDLLVANGFERDGMNADVLREIERRKASRKMGSAEQLALRELFPRLDTPNLAFRNLGNLRFAECSQAWGFAAAGVSQGLALADLDGDGDLDGVINNLNGPAMLYRNEGGAPRLAVRLRGLPPNTAGIGATIRVLGGPVEQMQEMICGGRYLSSDDAQRVFAAGSPTNRLRVEVTWRSRRRSVVEDVPANQLLIVEEASANPPPAVPAPPFRESLFEDLSPRLKLRHQAEPLDGWTTQPLLPKALSSRGPGLSWVDIDGDGWEDLLLGGSRGAKWFVVSNRHQGLWLGATSSVLSLPLSRAQTTLLAHRSDSRGLELLLGQSGLSSPLPESGVLSARAPFVTPQPLGSGLPASPGPLALADIDGDGTLELFVGGGSLPGRYPEAVPSQCLSLRSGHWVVDARSTNLLAGVGLVNGAVFSDLTGDGFPELLLATEWGPIRIFRNERGRFQEWNPRLLWSESSPPAATLAELTGCWNALAAGDFDGDGRLDFLASNWGENTRYEEFRAQPIRLYHGDFDGDGIVELIESHFEKSVGGYVPLRNPDILWRGLPWLRARNPTWSSMARETVASLLGSHAPEARIAEARWFGHAVFLNRGDSFAVVRLPDEAQFSPAFATTVADFDGDGALDVFLGQNFMATPQDTSRYDASRGLLLLGDGHGRFRPQSGSDSGIRLWGEQRGAAACDFDHDGRVDLAVAQVGEGVALLRNQRAAPGLCVRVSAGPGNPDGIGAVLRRGDGSTFGPAQEVHAGSGHWSQDSPVLVLTGSGSTLRVRFPGGEERTVPIPRSAREVRLDSTGKLTVLP